MEMNNLETRQKKLSSNFGFKCNCKLCHKQTISNDDERYKHFEEWQLKAEVLMEMSTQSPTYPTFLENIRNEILCSKEMYKLVQIKNPSRFITNYGFVIKIIDDGFIAGVRGYLGAKLHSDRGSMEFFNGECQKFSQVGLQLSEIISGSNSSLTKDWKERNCNFDEWAKVMWQGFCASPFNAHD